MTDRNTSNYDKDGPAVDPYLGVTKKASAPPQPAPSKPLDTSSNRPVVVDPYRGVVKTNAQPDANPNANVYREAAVDPYRGVVKESSHGGTTIPMERDKGRPVEGTVKPTLVGPAAGPPADHPIEAILSGPDREAAKSQEASRAEYKERVKEATKGAIGTTEEAFGFDHSERDPIHGQERSFGEEVADYVGRLYGSAKHVLGVGAEKTAYATGQVKETGVASGQLAKEEGSKLKDKMAKSKEKEGPVDATLSDRMEEGADPTAPTAPTAAQVIKGEAKEIGQLVSEPFKRHVGDNNQGIGDTKPIGTDIQPDDERPITGGKAPTGTCR